LIFPLPIRIAGSAIEELDVDYDATPIDIGFNARYSSILPNQLDSDTVLFQARRPRSPTSCKTVMALAPLCADADAGVSGLARKPFPTPLLG